MFAAQNQSRLYERMEKAAPICDGGINYKDVEAAIYRDAGGAFGVVETKNEIAYLEARNLTDQEADAIVAGAARRTYGNPARTKYLANAIISDFFDNV